jgi:NAD(P)-dependent dehydrogenase (short-subunit alcohol dehydrogenase family)
VAGYRRGLRLRGSVVVVAGASGPVGRATVGALAAHGARPVVVDAHAENVGQALTVPADLTDPDAVQDAAGEVVDRCGRIDGWVQCPGAPTSGALLGLPLDDVRRVVDRDLLGAVHGARAALPHMIAAGNGVLVVVASVHGQVARPFEAPGSMAAAAVRVMAGALREELRLDGVRGVAVTAVLAPTPRAVPGPARVLTRAGLRTPRDVAIARTVLRQLRHPRLEKVAGGPVTKAVVHGHALVPGLTEWLVARRAGG